jgi:hypothetical protein
VSGALAYAAYWCEENVWHLCADARVGEGERTVALVTNAARTVALWHQRAASVQPVVWDYHVLLFAGRGAAARAWDLDSTLGAPIDAADYLARSFRPCAIDLQPRFRVLAGASYRDALASDRRHMRAEDGSWRAPPPSWPTIGHGHTLDRLLDLDAPTPGEIVDLAGLRARLGL